MAGRRDKGLPLRSDTVVDDRPGILGEGIPNHRHSVITSSGDSRVHLRFDTATDDVDSPGRAEQRAHQGVLGNYVFDRLQSLVGLDRGENGFPRASIDIVGMSGGAEKSVVEHVIYTRWDIGVVLSRQGIAYLEIALGRWDWLRCG